MTRACFGDFMYLHSLISDNDTERLEDLVNFRDFSKDVFLSLTQKCESPISVAASWVHLGSMRVLLKHGLGYCRDDECPPLITAAARGSLDIVQFLLEEYGQGVNMVDRVKETALFAAVRSGNSYLVKYLIKSGADINHLSVDGSVLHESVTCQNVEMCNVILSQHFKHINARGFKGNTALHTAIRCNCASIIELLLVNGADANMLTCRFKSPFMLAVPYCNLSVLKLLILHGADPDTVNGEGERPIQIAAKHCQLTLVHLLAVTLNVPMNRHSTSDTSLLSYAMEHHMMSMIILLLEAGYQVDSNEYNSLSNFVKISSPSDFVLKYISRVLSTPRSLTDSCCFSIRRVLGKNLPQIVDSLPLPRKLVDFVKLSHLDLEDIIPADILPRDYQYM